MAEEFLGHGWYFKRALYTLKEPHIHSKEPYISSKEPYIQRSFSVLVAEESLGCGWYIKRAL